MNPFDRLAEWLLSDLPKMVPGAVIAAMALIFWPGIGLLLPIWTGLSGSWFAVANIAGTVLAATLALGWLILQVKYQDRRHLLEWSTDLRLLDAEEFEWLVGEVFRREGWAIEETGRQDGPDGGVDLRLTKGAEQRIVQCKRWESWRVGPASIREFAGTLSREHLSASAGVFVTLSTYTDQARDEAKKLDLTLIDGTDLLARIEKVRRAEPCPDCGAPMVFDRSPRGWWFRCPKYPDCAGKRDLGSDVGRAAELLARKG
jgi:hypothetical protein